MSRMAGFFLMIVAPALSIILALLGLETLSSNALGCLLLVLGIAYPAGCVIAYFIKHKPFWKSTDVQVVREEKGDRSFWLILPGFLAVFFTPPLEWMYLPDWLPRLPVMQVAGLSLVFLGILLRFWSRSHIRNLYSGHVEIRSNHLIIQGGPYRKVRHPGYAGFLLVSLGFVLGYSSLFGLVGLLLLLLPGLAYRMRVEEQLLEQQFGDEYREYARRSNRIIPGIW